MYDNEKIYELVDMVRDTAYDLYKYLGHCPDSF
jgi:hypothetical protein